MTTRAVPEPAPVPHPGTGRGAELAEQVRAAAAAREPLRIVGRGTWLDAGRPVRAAARLDAGALRGIVEYTPGDLTLTALAGTSLAEIAAATRAEGQWLAFDPAGGDAGSIGATVATASAGPAAHSSGTPRDNVLGLEIVTGTGDTVRAGGRVVKNVAGFDLVRLNTGAWGTLGVITEVTVRLRALPAADETVALALPAGAARTGERLRVLREAPLLPLALELLSGALARRLGIGDGPLLVARLAGNEASVRAQRLAMQAVGDTAVLPNDVWERLRTAEPAGAATARLSCPVSRLAELWGAAAAAADAAGGWAHASPGRGVVRVVLPDAARARDAILAARPAARAVAGERLPGALWDELVPTAVNDPLSRGVRRAFDPHRLLNPGILGEDLS